MICKIFLLVILATISLAAINLDIPYGVQHYYADGEINVFWFYQNVNKMTFNNHAITPKLPYIVSEQEDDSRVVTLIADYHRESPLQSIEIYIWGEDLFPGGGNQQSEFAVSLYSQFPVDATITPVWGEIITHALDVPQNGKWHEIAVHEYFHYDTLYFQFRWLAGTPASPMLSLDNDSIGSLSYYGYLSDEELLYSPLYDGELLLKLNYTEPDTAQLASGELPDSFSVFLDIDSSNVMSKPESVMNISDSLHLSLMAANANNFLAIAAWNENQLSERSVPLLLSIQAETFPLLANPEILTVTTEINETYLYQIEISNPLTEIINLHISVLESCEWLNLSRSDFIIKADSSITLEIIINNHDLDLGLYQCELMLQCYSENNIYKPALYWIENQVDATTPVEGLSLPERYTTYLTQNYPNPFNNTTVIYSNSSSPLNIFNIQGQQVASLTALSLQNGSYLFEWDGSIFNGNEAASGIYFYLQKDISASRKMLLLK